MKIDKREKKNEQQQQQKQKYTQTNKYKRTTDNFNNIIVSVKLIFII